MTLSHLGLMKIDGAETERQSHEKSIKSKKYRYILEQQGHRIKRGQLQLCGSEIVHYTLLNRGFLSQQQYFFKLGLESRFLMFSIEGNSYVVNFN